MRISWFFLIRRNGYSSVYADFPYLISQSCDTDEVFIFILHVSRESLPYETLPMVELHYDKDTELVSRFALIYLLSLILFPLVFLPPTSTVCFPKSINQSAYSQNLLQGTIFLCYFDKYDVMQFGRASNLRWHCLLSCS